MTDAFRAGARAALDAAQRAGARVAVLKDGSPSCGTTQIYDGSFSGRRQAGAGATAALLAESGVRVFSDAQLESAERCVAELEGGS